MREREQVQGRSSGGKGRWWWGSEGRRKGIKKVQGQIERLQNTEKRKGRKVENKRQ